MLSELAQRLVARNVLVCIGTSRSKVGKLKVVFLSSFGNSMLFDDSTSITITTKCQSRSSLNVYSRECALTEIFPNVQKMPLPQWSFDAIACANYPAEQVLQVKAMRPPKCKQPS